MRNAPAPADQCADEHRDTNRKTDQMSDPEKRKGQKEIVTGYCSAPADSKSLRDVRGENLRCHNDSENGGDDRSPQNSEQPRAAVFDIRSMCGITATANLERSEERR